jgi:hypothetical protein
VEFEELSAAFSELEERASRSLAGLHGARDAQREGNSVAGPLAEEAPKATVLVAEDDPAVRNVLRRILEKGGYQVIEARNGVEALEVCAAGIRHVDLVLLDAVMPLMSGRVFVERLLELREQPRVLLMSGYSTDEVNRHGEFPAGIPFMRKPLSLEELNVRVQEVLQARGEPGFRLATRLGQG